MNINKNFKFETNKCSMIINNMHQVERMWQSQPPLLRLSLAELSSQKQSLLAIWSPMYIMQLLD